MSDVITGATKSAKSNHIEMDTRIYQLGEQSITTTPVSYAWKNIEVDVDDGSMKIFNIFRRKQRKPIMRKRILDNGTIVT